MKDKIKRVLIILGVLLFWVVIWDILSIIIDIEFVLPRVKSTIKALFELLCTKRFYTLVLSSLLRIFSSFILGVIIAVTLSLFAIKFSFFKAIVSPLIIISKSTPVAVLIMILWLMIGGARVPGAVAILMVVPIIWQNMIEGYDSIDTNLEEVCQIYNFSYLKRLKILVLPTLLRFLFPGLITSCGLAWKAGIAAEIICLSAKSIGKEISNARSVLDGPKTFAYTIVVLLLSIAVEKLIKLGVEGVRRKCHL